MQRLIVHGQVGRGVGILQQGHGKVDITHNGYSLCINRVGKTGYGQGVGAFPYIGEMHAT